MLECTRSCIKPRFHKGKKELCQRWRDATIKMYVELSKDTVVNFLHLSHTHEDQPSLLDTLLSWWEVKGYHWSKWLLTQGEGEAFVPTNNLLESKHPLMRAALGYA